MVILSIFTPKAFSNFLLTNGESSFKFDPSFTRLFFLNDTRRWFGRDFFNHLDWF